MTVGELIKQLQEQPQDALAVMVKGDHYVDEVAEADFYKSNKALEGWLEWVDNCVEPKPGQGMVLIG